MDAQISMSVAALATLVASGMALGALIGLAIGARAIRRLRCELERRRRTNHLATLEELHSRMRGE